MMKRLVVIFTVALSICTASADTYASYAQMHHLIRQEASRRGHQPISSGLGYGRTLQRPGAPSSTNPPRIVSGLGYDYRVSDQLSGIYPSPVDPRFRREAEM